MLKRLYSNVGYKAMSQRLYRHVAEANKQCCRGYTAMLRRLYS